MTKDKILDWALMQDGGVGHVSKAMDEYARQQVIAFMNWTLSGDCDTYNCTDENQWTNIFTNVRITTDELYSQFIEQQTKE